MAETPKYAVFRWADFELMRRGNIDSSSMEHYLLPDAEVIRKQDMTSGPVLHLYANLIHAFQDLLDPTGKTDENLSNIADHFHNAALDADTLRLHGKAKLPD